MRYFTLWPHNELFGLCASPAVLVLATLSFAAAPLAVPVSAQAAETNQPAAAGQSPAQAKLTGFPFTDEDLNYSVLWPTGTSLGEAHLRARHSGEKWNFTFTIDASVPGFAVKDTYHSDVVPEVAPNFCSVAFDRSTTHGTHVTNEKETIDRERAMANRGGSQIPVPACVKDALAYVFWARRDMGQGHVPASQDILFGALHPIRVDYAGAPMILMGSKQVQTDEITCTWGLGSAAISFDVYFARDAARTPLRITAPTAMGKFSMELVR
jgi:hypothetical protein